jgi:hypothetical protein
MGLQSPVLNLSNVSEQHKEKISAEKFMKNAFALAAGKQELYKPPRDEMLYGIEVSDEPLYQDLNHSHNF